MLIYPNKFVCYAGCVTRDLFNFIKFNSDVPAEKRKPALSLGFCNISSMFCPKIFLDFNGFKESKYMSRNIEYDLTKVLESKIKESQAEWFIFDIINERIPIMQFEIEEYSGVKHMGYATKTPEFVNLWYYLLSSKRYKKMTKVRDYLFDDLYSDLNYDDSLKKFCTIIERKFGQDKIIFNEVYLNNGYVDKSGEYKEFNKDGHKIILDYNNIERANNFLKGVSSRIKNYLPNINVLNKPNYCISDSNHWLGLHPLHMKKTYYEYVCDCVDVIVNCKEKNKINEELSRLNIRQSENNYDLLTALKSQKEFRERCDTEKSLREKWQGYARTFKSIIINSLTSDEFRYLFIQKITDKGYHNIAIYGDTEITKILIRILFNSPVTIEYIVENVQNNREITTYPRTLREYPNVDLLLIADIAEYDKILAKLKRYNLSFPILNAAEFIMQLN